MYFQNYDSCYVPLFMWVGILKFIPETMYDDISWDCFSACTIHVIVIIVLIIQIIVQGNNFGAICNDLL